MNTMAEHWPSDESDLLTNDLYMEIGGGGAEPAPARTEAAPAHVGEPARADPTPAQKDEPARDEPAPAHVGEPARADPTPAQKDEPARDEPAPAHVGELARADPTPAHVDEPAPAPVDLDALLSQRQAILYPDIYLLH